MLASLFGRDGPLKLSKLRMDPTSAVADYGFVVAGSDSYDHTIEGGPCTIECKYLGNNIYKLTPSGRSGSDYYFPYVSQNLNGGVGQCRVPAGAADGTIVLTGAMNGCSLDVRRSGPDWLFRHDANGLAMASLPLGDPRRSGDAKCRIDVGHYMLGKWEQTIAASVGSRSTDSASVAGQPLHYLISVKTRGKWLVLNSGILLIQSAKATKYERLRGVNIITPIVTSF